MKTLKYTLALFIIILTFNSCQKEDHHQVSQNTDQVEAMPERSLESRNSSSCGYIASLTRCELQHAIAPLNNEVDGYTTDMAEPDNTASFGKGRLWYCGCLVEKYHKALGYNSQLYQAIDQSVRRNSNSNCSYTPDPQKVFDGILAHRSVSRNAILRKQVYMTYLRLVLDLDGTTVSKLEKSYHLYGNRLIEQVYDAARCGRFVFCPGVSNQNDNVSQAVNYMMTDGYWNMDKFYSKMSDLGYVDVYSAILKFERKYGLRLSNTERTKIRNRVSDGCNISKAVAEAYSRELHAELKIKYSDYRQSNVNIDQFLRQHGAEKYMATSVLYEAAQEHGDWDITDSESLLFHWEMFQAIAPTALSFLPYGIGDAIDIYNSCGQSIASWSCAFAIAGVAVPFDEIAAVFAKRKEIKALWKTVKNYKHFFKAWKKLFDFDFLRKNIDALEDVSKSLDEGLDALDAVEDAIQASGKAKPTWPEIKAFFKRGNDFNRKARTDGWYDYHEIHLANGKRLDSYDPDVGEIVSRKATDFDNIQTSTFENYLKEIDNKYAPGTIIRSNKYPDIDGQALQGSKILEVPSVNQNSSNLATFEVLASQYNTTIRYKPE